MKKLQNEVAIIAGGAGGIGLVTAKLSLEEGAKLMLIDLLEKQLIEAVATLKSKDVAFIAADVSGWEDVENYTAETLRYFGKIDILFRIANIKVDF